MPIPWPALESWALGLYCETLPPSQELGSRVIQIQEKMVETKKIQGCWVQVWGEQVQPGISGHSYHLELEQGPCPSLAFQGAAAVRR